MPPPFTLVFSSLVPTYTVIITCGLFVSLVFAARGLRHESFPGRVVDVWLAGIFGGLVLARAGHVALHWAYFRDHQPEITQIASGGLGWHGAFFGALIAIMIAARLRGFDVWRLSGICAPVLAVMAFAGWWGCGANQCAYGAEVDTLANYPHWLVWEAKDIFNIIAPRYRTQHLGMTWAIILLLLWWIMARRGVFAGRSDRRLWLLLGLLAAGMFGIGFLRGDEVMMWAGLRGDQWLDTATVAFAAGMFWLRGR